MNENVEQWNISKNAVSSKKGVVASQHWIASSVGADALSKGGNAIDAAIACAHALNVVEPWMCGLGGSGYILIWLAEKKQIKVIDFQGVLPEKISFDDYPLDENVPETIMGFPGVKDEQNVLGYKSITIPGAVAGLSLALQKFGRLGIDTILSKTIELAERGLPVDWHTTLQIALESKDLSKFKESSKIYLPDNFPPNPEQYIPLGNLLKTLKRISENGPDDFYKGEIADDICFDLKNGGSKISKDDLSSYEPKFIDPLSFEYKGKKIYTAGENSGGMRLKDTFNYLQKHFNSSKEIGADTYIAYAKALNSAFKIHRKKLKKNVNHGCTSHLSAVDCEGNMVALTYTLLNRFGSKVVLPRTGILMNNSVSYFDPRPGYPTSMEGKKRINSSNMCPTICTEGNRAYFSIGASGANHIVPCTMQIAGFLLDYNLSIEDAFNLPRIDVNENDIINVDASIDIKIIEELEKHFKIIKSQNLVFPKLYSCPSGVLRNSSGINFGIGDKSSPVASGKSEENFEINVSKKINNIIRA